MGLVKLDCTFVGDAKIIYSFSSCSLPDFSDNIVTEVLEDLSVDRKENYHAVSVVNTWSVPSLFSTVIHNILIV